MEGVRCLLCLTGVGQQGSSPSTWSHPRRKNVAGLCQLLSTTSHELISLDGIDNLEDGNVDLCSLCWDLIHEMEMIEKQISQLQGQIGKRIVVVRNRILTSEHKYRQPQTVEESELQRLRSIRNVLLRLSGTAQDNMDCEEVEIKIERDDVLLDELFDEPTTAFILHPDEDGPIIKTDDNDNTDSDCSFAIKPQTSPNLRHSQRRKQIKCKKATIPPKKVKRKGRSLNAEVESKAKQKVKTQSRNKKRISKPAPSSSESDMEINHPTPPDHDPLYSEEILGNIKTEDGSNRKQTQNLLKCNYCASKRFRTEESVSLHVQMMHPVSCQNCDRRFRTRNQLKVHNKREHPNIPLNQCPVCQKNCSSYQQLINHTFTRHETEDKGFTCGQCQKGFTVEFNFKRHLELHQVEGSKPFVCDLCDSRWTNKARLDAHLASHNKYCCKICSKVCASWETFARHQRQHTGEKPYKCDKCDETFIDYPARSYHIAKVHSTPDEHLLCPVCGKKVINASNLKIHMARHDGTFTTCKCDLCDEAFTEKSTLQHHKIEKHGADPFICDECGISAKSEKSLKRHKMARHTEENPHKCDICDARFAANNGLVAHMLVHTEERALPCPQCSQNFKRDVNLREHIKRCHMENFVFPTPYECSYPDCGKKFRFPGLLENHVRQVHTQERPFSCEVCNKSYAVPRALGLHKKWAHGIITGKCRPRPKTSKNIRQNPEPSCTNSSSNSSSNNIESLAAATQFTSHNSTNPNITSGALFGNPPFSSYFQM